MFVKKDEGRNREGDLSYFTRQLEGKFRSPLDSKPDLVWEGPGRPGGIFKEIPQDMHALRNESHRDGSGIRDCKENQ